MSPKGLLEDVLETLWGRLLVVSKFHFTFLSELVRLTNLTKSNTIIRGVFRTQSNFEDGFLLRKQLMLLALNYFREKAPLLKVDWIINTLRILSSNIIWLWSIAYRIFSGLVYHSYVLYILRMRNGLATNYITER